MKTIQLVEDDFNLIYPILIAGPKEVSEIKISRIDEKGETVLLVNRFEGEFWISGIKGLRLK